MEIDRLSYCLGMNFAFSEAVGSGVKPLALSPPLDPDEAETLLPPTRKIADEFGILLQVEEDLLTTRLFDPAFTAGKTVILMAADQAVLAEYAALKAARRLAGDPGASPELEGTSRTVSAVSSATPTRSSPACWRNPGSRVKTPMSPGR